jgi:hypothetical protein
MSQEALLSLLRVAEINGYTVALALVVVSPKLVAALCKGACDIISTIQGVKREKAEKSPRLEAPSLVPKEGATAQAA